MPLKSNVRRQQRIRQRIFLGSLSLSAFSTVPHQLAASPCGFIIGLGGSDGNLIRLGWLWRFGKFSPHPHEGKASSRSSARAEARASANVGQGHGAAASACGRRSVSSLAAAKSVASSWPCRTQPTRRLTLPSSGRAKGCALVPPLKSNVRRLSSDTAAEQAGVRRLRSCRPCGVHH